MTEEPSREAAAYPPESDEEATEAEVEQQRRKLAGTDITDE